MNEIRERINEPRRFIQIVIGPRQTGKTTAVAQGGFGKDASPRDVPSEYVMQPFDAKQSYNGKPWLTMELEVGHDDGRPTGFAAPC